MVGVVLEEGDESWGFLSFPTYILYGMLHDTPGVYKCQQFRRSANRHYPLFCRSILTNQNNQIWDVTLLKKQNGYIEISAFTQIFVNDYLPSVLMLA